MLADHGETCDVRIVEDGEVCRQPVALQLFAAARPQAGARLAPVHAREPAPGGELHDGCLAVMRGRIERCSNESYLQRFQQYEQRGLHFGSRARSSKTLGSVEWKRSIQRAPGSCKPLQLVVRHTIP